MKCFGFVLFFRRRLGATNPWAAGQGGERLALLAASALTPAWGQFRGADLTPVSN